MILSVLIPTLVERRDKFNALKSKLERLSKWYEVEILSLEDNREKSIGQKRNELVDVAQGKFSVFIDDDDDIPDDYFIKIMEVIQANPDLDCIGLKGQLTWLNNGKKEIFVHNAELPYSDGKVNGEYLRPPNHLNPMLTEYFRQIRFPEKSHGEDYDFCIKLRDSGLVKNCVFIDQVMYYYNFNPNK